MATYTGTQKHGLRRQVVVAIGAALTIVAAAGVGSWRIGLHEHSSSRTASTTQVQPQAGAQTSSPATAAGVQVSLQRQGVLYLVGSDEEAAQLRTNLGYISDPTGAPDVTIDVLPAGMPASSETLQFLIGAENESRLERGLQPMQLVDTRSQESASASSGNEVVASSTTPAGPVVFLTTADEQRGFIDQYIQQVGLNAYAFTLDSPDQLNAFLLPGVTLASAQQWQAVDSFIRQQRISADQAAINRAMTGE